LSGLRWAPAAPLSGKVSMRYFAGLLSNTLDRPVLGYDGTGACTCGFEWSSDEAIEANLDGPPSLFSPEENLGLRLDSRKTPVDLYVIDHVERLLPRIDESHNRSESRHRSKETTDQSRNVCHNLVV